MWTMVTRMTMLNLNARRLARAPFRGSQIPRIYGAEGGI
jgi:hypothetical protein